MNKINILIKGGLVQEVRVDSLDVDINVFDIDSTPELKEDWNKETKGQKDYIYDTGYSL